MSSTWMKLSPSVRGIARLSWTMTVRRRGSRRASPRRTRRASRSRGRPAAWRSPARRRAAGRRDRTGRDVRQEDRHVVGSTLVHRRPGVRADEQRPMPEMGRHVRREVWPRALGVEVDHPDVAAARLREQRARRAGPTAPPPRSGRRPAGRLWMPATASARGDDRASGRYRGLRGRRRQAGRASPGIQRFGSTSTRRSGRWVIATYARSKSVRAFVGPETMRRS